MLLSKIKKKIFKVLLNEKKNYKILFQILLLKIKKYFNIFSNKKKNTENIKILKTLNKCLLFILFFYTDSIVTNRSCKMWQF